MTFDVSQDSYQSLRAIVAERTDRILAWIGSGLSTMAGLPNWITLRSKLEGALINKAESLEPKDSIRLKDIAADSAEIGHVSAPNRPPCKKGSGSGAGMVIV